jgi:hypothetical protein
MLRQPLVSVCLVVLAGTAVPQAPGAVFGHPESCVACARGNCVPQTGTYGHYVTLWRRWPELTAPRSSGRPLPDVSPPTEIPGPLDEALIRRRTRSNEPLESGAGSPGLPSRPGLDNVPGPGPAQPPTEIEPFPATPESPDDAELDSAPFEPANDDAGGLPDLEVPADSDLGNENTRVTPRKPLRLRISEQSAPARDVVLATMPRTHHDDALAGKPPHHHLDSTAPAGAIERTHESGSGAATPKWALPPADQPIVPSAYRFETDAGEGHHNPLRAASRHRATSPATTTEGTPTFPRDSRHNPLRSDDSGVAVPKT